MCSSMLYVGWDGIGWDGWLSSIIGHRSSKSAFGANNRIDDHIKTSTSARVVGEAG